jgi:hypothetical protein
MKAIFSVILIIGLCSFNNSQIKFSKSIDSNIDTVLINKYQGQLRTANGTEKEFILQLIHTIKIFELKKLDTTILQIGHFDAIGAIDSIRTRIFEKHDTIYVSSEWRKNGTILWHKQIKNPYTWISESKLFQYDTRDKWVTFTIGIYQALPEISNIKEHQDLRELGFENGLENLKSLGINIKMEEYKNYILNYHGDLITFGDPVARDGMFIWYKPAKRFLLYYHE